MRTTHDVRNRSAVVVGLARSGLAAASLLLRQGARVGGTDLRHREALPETLGDLERQGLRVECGGHPEALLRGADFVVVSPGVPLDSSFVRKARALGLPVYGEIEVASWFCRAPIVAVTGSNGKTTTTTLLGQIFQRAGWEVEMAGNIGSPFSAVADHLSAEGIAVLEVSSFQLETIETFRPQTSVLLNFSPDHLDRYRDYEAYVAAKMRLFEQQTGEDRAVINADEAEVLSQTVSIAPQKILFSINTELEEGVFGSRGVLAARFQGRRRDICRVGELRLRGPHNLSNAAAAVAAALSYDIDAGIVGKAVTEFSGVEHRLEIVGDIDGITFVNDSKATNVVSVQYALQSFQQPMILIAGGREKGADFQPLGPWLAGRVKLLILLGEAAPKMRSALGGVVEVMEVASMAEAVKAGHARARAGDIVLLSPACASFDMYANYEERGADFKAAVRKLAGGRG